MFDKVQIYGMDEIDDCCYGVDITRCKNIGIVKEIMSKYQEDWDGPKKRQFLNTTFRNVPALMNYFDDMSEAEDYFSDYLTHESPRLNPDHIHLTYKDGKILFIPQVPWLYNKAERSMDMKYLFSLLQRVASKLGA